MQCSVDVQGKKRQWAIPANLSKSAIEDMRADGLNIIVPEYTFPALVADVGLIRPWCFFQDVLNFRNPFRK